MEKIESIEAFYQRRFGWIPDNIRSEMGHFNVFAHVPPDITKGNPPSYKRRDFYKIMWVEGNVDMQYADKVVNIKKQALFFSNPLIPYHCGHLERIKVATFGSIQSFSLTANTCLN
jgi:AraC family transcriptional regulator, transcriptional activator of pobA